MIGDAGYTLRIAPLPELVAVARRFAATLARRNGHGDEIVDAVRLAVSEAVTRAMMGSPDRVTLTLQGVGAGIRVGVWPITDAAPNGSAVPAPLEVVKTLFPDTDLDGEWVRWTVVAPGSFDG